jgi:hypothetical protein
LGGSPGDLNANFFDQILSDPVYPAASYFDVANFHQYGRASLAQARRDYVATELAKFGVSSRPIWVTEVGYGSAQQGAQADPAFKGLQGQATWLNNMLPLLLNQLGVAKVFWFTLWDDPSLGPFATDGLLDANANPKLAYSALSAALH